MKQRVGSVLGLFAAALAGATGVFVVTTVLMSQLPDVVTVASAAIGSFVLALAVYGLHLARPLVVRERREVLSAAIGGAAALWGAPLLALSQRASDAPPGAEVAFFTTSAWGLLAVLLAYGVRSERPRFSSGAAALLAAVGGASLLASWERPSSFSPFVRFPQEHLVMLVAGVVFGAGALAIAASCRTLGVRRATVVATGAAALLGTVSAIPAIPRALPALGATWPAILVLGVCAGAFAVSWMHLSASQGVVRAASVWLLVPAALTTLTLAERSISVSGPDPVNWPSAAAGVALALSGAAVMWTGAPRMGSLSLRDARVALVALPAVALGAVALFTGSIHAEVIGAFSEEYRASWTMLGGETAAGWLVFALSLLAAAAVVDASHGARITAGAASLVALGGAAALPFLSTTPLRTATRWIPAEVQQTYGTEYARLTFTPLNDPVCLMALALVMGVALVTLVVVVRSVARDSVSEGAE